MTHPLDALLRDLADAEASRPSTTTFAMVKMKAALAREEARCRRARRVEETALLLGAALVLVAFPLSLGQLMGHGPALAVLAVIPLAMGGWRLAQGRA